MLDYFKRAFTKKKIALVLILLIITAVVFGGFYLWQKRTGLIKPDYRQTYRLVNEKVSQGAAIAIHLPDSISKGVAQNNVSFYPEVEGKWLLSDKVREVIFKPKEKLKLNRYYAVELAMLDGGVIRADFLAVEDPEIIAIFPKENSEAPETSEITMVFNRPMVPLTTLGYLEEQEIPVEITPETKGRFKWITTRNLQFIPEERLVRSSNYKVRINSGLVSMDGLPVQGREIEFTTRKLRYLSLTNGEIIYNQPISIYFNQPVDLEKTKNEITLKNNTTGQEVPFIAEYKGQSKGGFGQESTSQRFSFYEIGDFLAGITSILGIEIDFWGRSKKENIDETVINIYNKKDRFGREKLWDFENSYSLIINKARPAEGDIILDENRTTNAQITGPIKNMWAESERTKYAGPDFFDPQGKLWVSFYEEIDLGKSKIIAQRSKEIGYGEKCKEEGIYISASVECEKIPDKKKIYLTFQSESIGLGERLEINFEKIVNTEDLTINKNPILRNIVSYPKFEVLKTIPANNLAEASLIEFILCSNSPILAPAKEDHEDYFQSNLDYELNSWRASWRISYYYEGSKCNAGEFLTSINYGLMPLADYSLGFKLEDVFGQKQDLSISFTTGEMPGVYLNFYQLQKAYNVTSVEKTELTYASQNMEYVNLDICKVNALNFLYYSENKPKYYDPPGSINCQRRITDRIELPQRYWIKNYFKVDIKDYLEDPIGHYILTFSHPDYKTSYWEKGKSTYRPAYPRTYLTVTNLAVTEKRIQPQYANYGAREDLTASQLSELSNLYWVTDLSTLEPVSGAKINLYRENNNSPYNLILAGSYNTDDQGIVLTDVVYNLKGVVIIKGKDSTIIPSNTSRLDWASSAFAARKVYLYTDKPIYRPGQEVFLKGIHRIGYDGNYEIYQDQKINLTVHNSKNDEILSRDLEINDFGTFNTQFVLNKNAPLGSYRICSENYSCVYFDVQEYVPAAFEVKLATDKEEYISKDNVSLKINAKYYFGVPLEGGEVEYTISSQNYYFDRYSDGYFNFGSRWYYWSPYNYGDKFILRGKTSINAEGEATISQLLDLERLFKEKEDRKSRIIVFNVTVKNTQGQSISSQKSFILHSGEFYLGLRSDKSFLGKNEKFNLRIKSVDIQGKSIKASNVTLNLYKIDWIYSKRQEAGGGYQYKWEKKRELVKRYKFNTDSNGNYTQEFQISQEGSYEAEASSSDSRNNLIFTTYNLYIYGKGSVSIRPTTDTSLEIETEKTNLNVGEDGKLIIKSPYSKAKALISIERGKIFNYQVKEIEGNLFQYDFKVKEEYLPNIYVSVLLISSKPEIKFGKVEFRINTERKELDIEVTANKKHYLPGEMVTLDILAKDYRGRGVSAEVSVSVVDLSVLALKGNPKKNPLVFFYGGFPLTVSTASNVKDILVEAKIPTKGGGGLSSEALAVKKRGIFRETAFWQAVAITDTDGRAQINFILPDNLTTWQAETLGITKDTKIGVNYQEFIARKELMIIPLKPRFVVPGDIFHIGAQVFNQSEKSQKLTVSFDSPTLILQENKPEKEIKIKPKETKTIYFKVQAFPQIKDGEHKFVLSAKGEKLEDTVEQSINITPDNTYEVTATANYTSDLISKEYVFLPDNVVRDRGELTINSSGTLAVFLSDALNYLLGFPYGCSEQIASKLNAIAIVKRGLNLPNINEKFKLDEIKYQNKEYSIEEIVEIGLAEIYNNQQQDGGFSYWKGGKSNFYLTLHVVDTLNNTSLAGFNINQNSLKRASDYLYKQITTDWRLYKNKNTVILAAYTLFKLPNFSDGGVLKRKIIDITNDDLFIREQISNTSLVYLAILLNEGFDGKLKEKVLNILDNRIDIDGRGAFLETGQNFFWQYYETPIKNTALYLKALTIDKRDNEILDKVVRWLLNSREKDGAWGSTNNTITVIDAFTDFLEWRRETESDFTLELIINEKTEDTINFNAETILDQFKKEVPLQNLKFNENNTITFQKTNHNELPNNLYYDLALKYYLPVDKIPPRDEGFSVTREFYQIDDKKNENPVREAKIGDVLRGHLQIIVPKSRNFVMVEDYIPAGMEIINLELATEQKSLLLEEEYKKDKEYWRKHFDKSFYPDFKEIHDDRVFLYKEFLAPGVYEFDYYVRVLIKGEFSHLPAIASEMYFPENFGRTDGRYFKVE